MNNDNLDRLVERYTARNHMVDGVLTPKTPWDAVCDFCGLGATPLTAHDAEDVETPAGLSVGAWCACEECTALIYRLDKEGLAQRAIAYYSTIMGPELAENLVVRPSQDAFWSARKPPG